MQSNLANTKFQIGKAHIELTQGGESIQIADRDVQGVSTQVLLPERQSRVVQLEYRDQNGQLRNAAIQQRVSDNIYEDLPEYVRRVSVNAAENSLQELVANNTVERHGFMINDQAVMLTASGETLCCGLFDLQAIEFAGDHTLLWTNDNPEPAAILRREDPNSLTLSKLLTRLIGSSENEDTGLPRLIGRIVCDPSDAGSAKVTQVFALVIAVVAGVTAAMVTANGLNAPNIPVLIGLIPVGLPLLIIFAWLFMRSAPTLGVFQHGICIQRNKHLSSIDWADIVSLQLTDREISIGEGNRPILVRIYTLHLQTVDKHHFGKQIKLKWQLNDKTQMCTDFLLKKSRALNESRQVDWSKKDESTSTDPSETELMTV